MTKEIEVFWDAYVTALLELHSCGTDDWDDLNEYERDGISAGVAAVVDHVKSEIQNPKSEIDGRAA